MSQMDRWTSSSGVGRDPTLPATRIPSGAQRPQAPGRHVRPAAIAQLRRQIRHSPVALVTSRDTHGALHTAPMVASDREFDGELWFPAAVSAPVIQHVLAHPEIQVTYADSTTDRSMVLDGIAHVCQGRELARALWQSEFGAMFPRGPNDAELAFIRVEIVSADLWE